MNPVAIIKELERLPTRLSPYELVQFMDRMEEIHGRLGASLRAALRFQNERKTSASHEFSLNVVNGGAK